MATIKLEDGRVVSKKDYITAKTKALKEFGYTSLTEKEVSEQLDKILKGEELSVIGMFMKDDIDNSTGGYDSE
jgi:hypothetical protein